jgi:DNA invertase Pin-like site-specific DNA recombinase
MLADIKAGRIKRVIVKDMSRFGRDYLQVGMYTDVVFPEFGVHFIAVNDGVDSTRGESEFTAIRNVFNEMYARDTSKKIRATWQSKGKSGEHLTTIPPYGYMKSPEDKKIMDRR